MVRCRLCFMHHWHCTMHHHQAVVTGRPKRYPVCLKKCCRTMDAQTTWFLNTYKSILKVKFTDSDKIIHSLFKKDIKILVIKIEFLVNRINLINMLELNSRCFDIAIDISVTGFQKTLLIIKQVQYANMIMVALMFLSVCRDVWVTSQGHCTELLPVVQGQFMVCSTLDLLLGFSFVNLKQGSCPRETMYCRMPLTFWPSVIPSVHW